MPVTNVKSEWSGGNLVFKDNSGNTVLTITPTGLTNEQPITVADGGTVTQITNKTTGVTLSTLSGQITTVSLDNAAGVDSTFTVTNTKVAATDVVVANVASYGGTADGIPVAYVSAVAAGSFDITIRNTGATTLDALAVVNFVVIKGSSS